MKQALLTFVALLATVAVQAIHQEPMRLWYDRPADFFEESLPLGNGKLGALVYGGTSRNVIYLNDITLWTGKPVDQSLDPDAHEWIPRIREALFNEDYALADSLQLHVQGPNSQFYQPLGTLFIDDLNEGTVSSYHRSLNLDSALLADCYLRGGLSVSREYFASNPDKLIAIRLRGDINVRLTLTAQIPHRVKSSAAANGGIAQLTMTGHAIGDPDESIHFCTMLKAEADGTVSASDSVITISKAKEAVVYIVNETSFNGARRHPVREGAPYLDNAANDLWHTANFSYGDFRRRHVQDYQQFYNRVQLHLGDSVSDAAAMPTDQLLKQYTDGGGQSRYLETLYFQYGRYLLIASSRTPGVPANLQGLWTPHVWSPWRGNYTVNINLEENYWPAFVSNLAEMAQPLDDFIAALAENGKHTARNYYGVQEGWCSSHNSDIWAMTNPVGEKRESPMWANWNMGGAWLVNTLWERYQFTKDKDYLRQVAYPLMAGALDFCMGWLIENPKQPGELITAPSTSPENEYKTDKGYHGVTCYGGTADLAIIRELLLNTVWAAAEVCGDSLSDGAYRTMLLPYTMLHPYTIGKHGDLNEWYYDWDDWDPHHRHQSHLIGLYPGNHIRLMEASNTQLLGACEQTLIQKGDQTTGWSTGWRINLWARLKKAEQAYHIYQKLLTYVSPDKYDGPDKRRSGGTYPNLFDAHPPFQIDGNFGGTAGVCEMLVQSDDHTIELLPALPQAWADGEVSGLCARGGFEVSMKWRNGQVTEATVTSKAGEYVKLLYNNKVEHLRLKAGERCTLR